MRSKELQGTRAHQQHDDFEKVVFSEKCKFSKQIKISKQQQIVHLSTERNIY